MEELMRLKDQVAIVTGAGRNIGEDVCKLYVEEGAKVAVVDMDQGRGGKVAAEINSQNPGKAIAVVCDVLEASVDSMVQAVVKQFGGVDILVNNAAWTDHKTIFDITEEEWDRTMNVCLRSVWYCSRAAARVMIDQKRQGKIINVAWTSGHWGRKEATAYTTAKAGVLNLTRSLAVQLAPEGIRVNSISPNRIGSPVGQQDVPENRFVKNLRRTSRRAHGYRQGGGVPRLRRVGFHLRYRSARGWRRTRDSRLIFFITTRAAALQSAAVDFENRRRLIPRKAMLQPHRLCELEIKLRGSAMIDGSN